MHVQLYNGQLIHNSLGSDDVLKSGCQKIIASQQQSFSELHVHAPYNDIVLIL